jgi:hypothetical protein
MKRLPDNSLSREAADAPVLGWLTPRDFALARRTRGFALWANRREFLEERDALYVGYGAAGIMAHRQIVPFEAFGRWARLTGAPVNVDGLDEFAAHWRWRAAHRDAPTIGRFGAPGDPERHAVEAAGAQCLRIRPELFVRWRDDLLNLDLFAAPSLDAYAAQVVEFCIGSGRFARRPAVRASYGSSAELEERE